MFVLLRVFHYLEPNINILPVALSASFIMHERTGAGITYGFIVKGRTTYCPHDTRAHTSTGTSPIPKHFETIRQTFQRCMCFFYLFIFHHAYRFRSSKINFIRAFPDCSMCARYTVMICALFALRTDIPAIKCT